MPSFLAPQATGVHALAFVPFQPLTLMPSILVLQEMYKQSIEDPNGFW